MGRVQDKVVVVTGAARGQGRSHSIKLAKEGADIILFDSCYDDIETNKYQLDGSGQLEKVGLEVTKTGRRAYTAEVDVRDGAAVVRELSNAVVEFGGLDVVVINADICPLGAELGIQAFVDAFHLEFIGVINTVQAALPHMQAGASIIVYGSSASLLRDPMSAGVDGPFGLGGAACSYAKQMVNSYMLRLATQLVPQSIRANAVHRTIGSPALQNSGPMCGEFRSEVDQSKRDGALEALPALQATSIPYVDPEDVANVVCFLASDDSREITGLQFLTGQRGFTSTLLNR